jgi:glycosyltransferase involved in cell wall biosynthesis
LVPDVILPVLDEAQAIPNVIAGLPLGFNPIVVDNASTDGSADVARRCGAHVVFEARRGFGAACWTGLLAATDDVVCFMDCDGSFLGADLVAVAGPVVAGDADLVLGARHASRGSWPIHARAANRFLAWELQRRTRINLTDLGPMRAARRLDLLALGVEDRRFGWPLEMVLRAAHAGWRVREVPVGYLPRIGQSKVTGTLSGTARAVKDMARVLQ